MSTLMRILAYLQLPASATGISLVGCHLKGPFSLKKRVFSFLTLSYHVSLEAFFKASLSRNALYDMLTHKRQAQSSCHISTMLD